MEWSIQEIARLVGTTSRTLRHYDERGLVPPARIGSNGYRYYGVTELRLLQRVLLLRELGLGLDAIERILASDLSEREALAMHLTLLTEQHDRIAQQIAGVHHTLATLDEGEEPVAEHMLAGFDHTQYLDEVEERWGAKAAEESGRWWRELSATDKEAWMAEVNTLNRAWQSAAEAGESPQGITAQRLAAQHIAWLRSVPGTPMQTEASAEAYIRGLGEMYVSDARFAANYGGAEGATLVRDALVAHLESAKR